MRLTKVIKGKKRVGKVWTGKARGVNKACVGVQGPDVRIPKKLQRYVKPAKRMQVHGCKPLSKGGLKWAINRATKLANAARV